MARKDFKQQLTTNTELGKGFDSYLNPTSERESPLQEKKELVKRGRPTTSTREITKTSQEGTREGETRATFIVKEGILETLKALAFWERKQIKATIQEALEAYIATRTPAQIKQAQKAYEESKQ
jgi:hypothetical protein